jgi:hypothetical protein
VSTSGIVLTGALLWSALCFLVTAFPSGSTVGVCLRLVVYNSLSCFIRFREYLLNEAGMQAKMMLFYQLPQQGFDSGRMAKGFRA